MFLMVFLGQNHELEGIISYLFWFSRRTCHVFMQFFRTISLPLVLQFVAGSAGSDVNKSRALPATIKPLKKGLSHRFQCSSPCCVSAFRGLYQLDHDLLFLAFLHQKFSAGCGEGVFCDQVLLVRDLFAVDLRPDSHQRCP